MVKDWEAEAGLKKEPKPKKLDNWAKYIPTLSEMASGLFAIILGALALRGGGFAIQLSPDSEPIWVLQNYTLPSVVCWGLIWIGIDIAILKGRATNWIFRRFVAPAFEVILKATIGEEKLKAWDEKLKGRMTQKS